MSDSLRGRHILVTGGLGFIGSRLVEKIAEGNEVTVACNKGGLNIAKKRFSHLDVDRVELDVRDTVKVKETIAGKDIVFHLASKARPRALRSPKDFREAFEVNVNGTYNVLEACRDAEAKLVFPSTREVYGEPLYSPINEEHPVKPKDLYVASKLAAEQYCQAFHNVYGLKVVILRLTNVYGPGDRDRVVPTFIQKASTGEALRVFENQHIDFVYVDDVAQAMVLAASKGDVEGEIFNIGTGVAISLTDLADLIIKLTGSKSIVLADGQSGDLTRYVLNIDKAARLLGYKPKVQLEEGLRRTIEFERKHKLVVS